MNFLVIFTLVDYQRSRRTALILADSKGQAHRVLVQNLSIEELENLSSIKYDAMHSISTISKMSGPVLLGIIY